MAYHFYLVEIIHEINQQDTSPYPKLYYTKNEDNSHIDVLLKTRFAIEIIEFVYMAEKLNSIKLLLIKPLKSHLLVKVVVESVYFS
ncbi:MAG: hypothetical protein ACTS7E_00885 [Arsenophonus sp. NC-CH8-MAG3]